jgi:hypothetical protein
MLNELLIGIAVTAVSALGFVAYRHPSAYRRLALIVSFTGTLCFIMVFVFNALNISGGASVLLYAAERIPDSKISLYHEKIAQIYSSVNQIGLAFVVLIALLVFVFFLLQLPRLGISSSSSDSASAHNDRSAK